MARVYRTKLDVRRKPKLEVKTAPAVPRAGDRLTVWLSFTSKNRTPVKRTVVSLAVSERLAAAGQESSEIVVELFRLQATFGAEVLERGTKKMTVFFDLPGNLPPTFEGSTSVRATLTVRVEIPWWFTLEESFVLQFGPRLVPTNPRGAKVFATHAEGPKQGQPYMEATLDPGALALGGQVQGAVSISMVPKSLQAGLLIMSAPTRGTGRAPALLRRYEATLGQPEQAGRRLLFSVGVPANEVPSLELSLARIHWVFELNAEFTRGAPLSLQIPVEMATVQSAPPLAALPPIGEERRLRVWAEVGRRLAMSHSANEQLLSKTLGAISVELRGVAGEFGLEGKLTWPSLGIELRMRRSDWTDGFRLFKQSPVEGLFVSAREAPQVAPFCASDLVAVLSRFESFEVDDDSCQVRFPRGSQRTNTLLEVATNVLELAQLLDHTIARVPPPARATALLPAWRDFAAVHRAQLEVGSLSLRALPWEDAEVDIETRWSDDGEAIETVVTMPLGAEITDAASAARVLEAPSVPGISLEAGPPALGGQLRLVRPGLVSNPTELLDTLAALSATRNALIGANRRGAYR